MRWQVQEAKQRFSEVLRAAETEPQIVTKHGEEVAVVIDIAEYRRMKAERPSLIKHLRAEPFIDYDLEELIDRPREFPREVDLGE